MLPEPELKSQPLATAITEAPKQKSNEQRSVTHVTATSSDNIPTDLCSEVIDEETKLILQEAPKEESNEQRSITHVTPATRSDSVRKADHFLEQTSKETKLILQEALKQESNEQRSMTHVTIATICNSISQMELYSQQMGEETKLILQEAPKEESNQQRSITHVITAKRSDGISQIERCSEQMDEETKLILQEAPKEESNTQRSITHFMTAKRSYGIISQMERCSEQVDEETKPSDRMLPELHLTVDENCDKLNTTITEKKLGPQASTYSKYSQCIANLVKRRANGSFTTQRWSPVSLASLRNPENYPGLLNFKDEEEEEDLFKCESSRNVMWSSSSLNIPIVPRNFNVDNGSKQ